MGYRVLILSISIFIFSTSSSVYAQPREPDPNTGDPNWRKLGWMNGNMVNSPFYNFGEIADWRAQILTEWPKGSGHLYLDGGALIVQVECVDNNGDTIHPMEIQYYEFMDINPETGEPMGWEPVPDYCNYYQDSPSMSNDPNTWPDHWPDKPASWDGYWNGYFGKGVKNADLETYFVMDDDNDLEWNFYPDSTDTTRRGIGIEVAVRAFQWSHVLAEDCIFWHFAITNEGTYDYEKAIFGYRLDWGIGECLPNPGGDNDCGSYDTLLDLAYAWDYGRIGDWGGPSGYAGFSYLESPGEPDDGIDNDDDGIIDESRTSGPGVWEYSPCGYYREDGTLDEEARASGQVFERWHWSGDEDGDWHGFTDLNGNGVWDPGEPLNDDLGEDGIGPFDEGYTGRDEGEGDGIPTSGEPNFDETDKDESDQIGLTGFNLGGCSVDNEEENWELLSQLKPPTERELVGVNLGMAFASGPFHLSAGETQRFSLAFLFGYDYDDLVRTKKTVQAIYNANYNFSKPPKKPYVRAVPGDGKVTLYWDDVAEGSYDRYLREYDFEGYKIYRSTEPSFLEVKLITDAYGNPTYKKPLDKYDLKNGIKGTHPVGVYGVQFDLGDDTGLRHIFVDSTVNNGQTYYYAVCSYDHGYIERDEYGDIRYDEEGNIIGIAPTECTSIITLTITGEIETDINTVVVTPQASAAGYTPPQTKADDLIRSGPGTGAIWTDIIDPDFVKDGHRYKVIFSDTSLFHLDEIATYTIIDVTASPDTLITDCREDISPIFDGLTIYIKNDATPVYDDSLSSWIVQQNNCEIEVGFDPRLTNELNPVLNLNMPFPADFKLIFSDSIVSSSTSLLGMFRSIPTNFLAWNETDSMEWNFLFDDKNKDLLFTIGDNIILLVPDPSAATGWRTTWEFTLVGPPATYDTTYLDDDSIVVDTTYLEEPILPQPGDVFHLRVTKPFRGDWVNPAGDTLRGDVLEFTIEGESFSEEKATSDLDRIAVVPNPYICAVSWEAPTPFQFGRGERKIFFIHLPPKCTIRIYTVRGNLVKTIEHESTMRDGSEPWNLVTKDGMDIAYGLYIYHIDAPGIGEKIGKFAVIK